MVGFGLSFRNSGLDLDRKIWQSAHLCSSGGLVLCSARHVRYSSAFFTHLQL